MPEVTYAKLGFVVCSLALKLLQRRQSHDKQDNLTLCRCNPLSENIFSQKSPEK